MKIAITSNGPKLTDPLDSRFGRSALFIIYDLESDSYETVDNQQNLNAAQGAGIQASETILRSRAEALLTGHCGPKAFRVLAAAGVKVFLSNAETVADAINLYRKGELTETASADVNGHWV